MTDEARVATATAQAGALLRAALAETTPQEQRRSARLGRLLADPQGRALLFALTDEVLRTNDDRRAIHRLARLVAAGVPRSFGPFDRLAMRIAASAGRAAPALVAPAVRARVKAETRGVILPATDPAFAEHVA